MHPVTVRRDIQRIKEQNSWMLDNIDERKVVLDLIQTAEVASARLMKNGRIKDAWTVNKELVETLLELGYLKSKQPDLNENPTFVELLKLASEHRSQDNNGVDRDRKTPNA